METIKRAGIGARVSTSNQTDLKTIISQVNELRKFCDEKGFKVIKEYQADGYSGATLDRPDIIEIIKDAEAGLLDVVVFYSEDRVARDDEAIDAVLFERQLKKLGVELIYMNDSGDDFTKAIKRAVASYERKVILQRTARGRMDRIRRGACWGHPAFGWDYEKSERNGLRHGEWKANPEKAKVVNFIYDTYIKYHGINRIAKELIERGILTPTGRRNWREITLRRILRDESYIGTAYFNKTYGVEVEPKDKTKPKKYIKNGRRKRDRKDWIEIKVPPIVEKEKWLQAQQIRQKNFERKARETTPYLLSGLVRCGKCNSSMTGTTDMRRKGITQWYRCCQRKYSFPYVRECKAKSMRADELDKAVWDTISNALRNPQVLIQRIKMLTGNSEKETALLNEEKKDLIKQRQKIEKDKEALLDLYTANPKLREMVLKKIEGFSEVEINIEKSLANIEKRNSQIMNKPLCIKNLQEFCNLTGKELENMGFEKKQRLLKILLEKVIYNSDTHEVKIIGYVPMTAESQNIDLRMPISQLLGRGNVLPELGITNFN